MPSFRTVLLTGTAGKIGLRLREHLRPRIRLRSTDILPLDPPQDGEETACCDLSDPVAARSVVAGVDAIVHMAGIPREAPIEQIASANLIATYNVFAAAHVAGVKRIVFGSTNHVVGFYPVEQSVDASAAPRPDTLYGASKVFGEAVARLFWDKHGIESVCIRIGSALDKPTNVRQLGTWVSYPARPPTWPYSTAGSARRVCTRSADGWNRPAAKPCCRATSCANMKTTRSGAIPPATRIR